CLRKSHVVWLGGLGRGRGGPEKSTARAAAVGGRMVVRDGARATAAVVASLRAARAAVEHVCRHWRVRRRGNGWQNAANLAEAKHFRAASLGVSRVDGRGVFLWRRVVAARCAAIGALQSCGVE